MTQNIHIVTLKPEETAVATQWHGKRAMMS
jgi:hypothetical protein